MPSASSSDRPAGTAAFAPHRRRRRGRRTFGGRGCGCLSIAGDHAHHGIDLHRVPGLDFDLLQCAGSRRRNFGVHLVGGNLKQRFVALDLVPRLLEPLGDGPFKNRFAHLGHDYVCRHVFLPRNVGLEPDVTANHSLYRASREAPEPLTAPVLGRLEEASAAQRIVSGLPVTPEEPDLWPSMTPAFGGNIEDLGEGQDRPNCTGRRLCCYHYNRRLRCWFISSAWPLDC